MDAGRRDAGGERIAQGGIKLSALRRPGLRTATVVAALPDSSHHFTVAQPAAAIALAAAAAAAAALAAAAAAALAASAAALAASAVAAATGAPHRLTASTVCDHG